MKPNIEKVRFVHDPDLDNTVQYWGFFAPKEIRLATVEGSLLMLDVDFGRQCSLHCHGCFRRNNVVDDGKPDLSYEELMRVIDGACLLGLKSVKICGAGEPTEDSRLLKFAKDLTDRDVGMAIFTKGHVIGNDQHVARIFGSAGVSDGPTLCKHLAELKTSVLLSYPSFDDGLLCSLVGDGTGSYPAKLKRAAELLANAGFNQTRPTRLAFVHAPMTQRSIAGAFDVYKFTRESNILPVLAFHMVSGEQIDDEFLRNNDPTEGQKLELFCKVLEYNFQHGIQTPQQVMESGPSCMPGIQPCNQIAVGLYVTANGNVVRCPGDCGQPLGNVREISIAEIWEKARVWRWSGKCNVGCPYKDNATIPKTAYEDMLTYARLWH